MNDAFSKESMRRAPASSSTHPVWRYHFVGFSILITESSWTFTSNSEVQFAFGEVVKARGAGSWEAGGWNASAGGEGDLLREDVEAGEGPRWLAGRGGG